MLTQIPGELQTFAAPVVVDVKARRESTSTTFEGMADKAVQVWMNSNYGTGPGTDSMAMIRVDWGELTIEGGHRKKGR